jgi:hypothetical protein
MVVLAATVCAPCRTHAAIHQLRLLGFPQIDASPVLLLPRLKQIILFDVSITKTAMHRLLAACTTLEGLQLQGISGFSTLSIASPSLHTIGVSCWSNSRVLKVVYHLVIEDAPSHERLILLD